jgi:hypothetical protein
MNTRLTVNITPATASALRRLSEREGVTITEALRRLVGYGDLVHQASEIEGREVLVRSGNEVQKVFLLGDDEAARGLGVEETTDE